MMRAVRVLVVVTMVTLASAVTSAQPAETCGPGALLGPVTLPFNSSAVVPTAADFDTTAAGCTDATGQVDVVACFTPTNACTINMSCASAGGAVANLTQGVCTTTPASCVSSASGNPTADINGQAVLAATQYCIICTRTGGVGGISVDITTASGDCGAMPVTLTRISVE